FLHNMVRCLVGTMTEVARGRYTAEDFVNFLEHPDKEVPVYRAPAHGLYLNAVEYHQALFETMPSLERSKTW
ncbi:MAG: hypothetical protein GWO23_21030, partial [Gammaproteobacteria bacterium]|nr:hypothetical protein [Gammaproteobacteria bacterium]NIW45702.1 hypothetical protein [Gammaproteobacteria bacterium]NIX02297.1 hypothetical protein [Phycisphaerae bacterium]